MGVAVITKVIGRRNLWSSAARLVRRIRAMGSDIRLRVMAWCEANGLEYFLG